MKMLAANQTLVRLCHSVVAACRIKSEAHNSAPVQYKTVQTSTNHKYPKLVFPLSPSLSRDLCYPWLTICPSNVHCSPLFSFIIVLITGFVLANTKMSL